MSCQVQCFDLNVLMQWLQTCNEFLGFTLKPCQKMRLSQVFCCGHGDWAGALTVWCVIQFWLAVTVHTILLIVSFIPDCGGDLDASRVISALVSWAITIGVCYFFSHLFWFGAAKKHGCCWCILCCPVGDLILLIMAIVCFLIALAFLGYIGGLGAALGLLSACSISFLYIVLPIIHAVSFVYMGICCLGLWQRTRPTPVRKVAEVKEPVKVVIVNEPSQGQTKGSAKAPAKGPTKAPTKGPTKGRVTSC